MFSEVFSKLINEHLLKSNVGQVYNKTGFFVYGIFNKNSSKLVIISSVLTNLTMLSNSIQAKILVSSFQVEYKIEK